MYRKKLDNLINSVKMLMFFKQHFQIQETKPENIVVRDTKNDFYTENIVVRDTKMIFIQKIFGIKNTGNI